MAYITVSDSQKEAIRTLLRRDLEELDTAFCGYPSEWTTEYIEMQTNKICAIFREIE